MDSFRDWAEFYKVLGDSTRLHLVALLAQGPRCVCELVEVLNVSQPTVSHHLSRLRHAGLIQEQRRGQWIFYSVKKDRIPFWDALVVALPPVTDDIAALDANNTLACHVDGALSAQTESEEIQRPSSFALTTPPV